MAGATAAAMAATILVASATVAAEEPSGPYVVTSSADAGPGSLREALATTGAIRIHASVELIEIDSTLVYDLDEPLDLRGRGVTITGDGLGSTLLRTETSSRIAISGIGFDDGGSYGLDSFAEGDAVYGLHVVVPAASVGTIQVALRDVSVSGVAGHGVFVDDNAASVASVALDVRRVTVDRVGIGAFDQDGIRVDEVGVGDLFFTARDSVFTAAGADGVEIDERGDGKVVFDVRRVEFARNGGYCIAEPVPLDVAKPCVEDDDGELVLDLDDGFDIDEADAGDIVGTLRHATFDANFDEGLDVDEAGEGVVDIAIRDVVGSGNTDETIKISEEDAGGVHVDARNVVAEQSGDGDGTEIEEEGLGNVFVRVRNGRFQANDGDGLKLEEDGDGFLVVDLRRVEAVDNAGDGVELSESNPDVADDGFLVGEIRGSRLADNGGSDLAQEGGEVRLTNVSFD